MNPHIIDEKDILPTILDAKVTLAVSSVATPKFSKGLYWLPATNTYDIYKDGELMLSTFFLEKAITYYNTLGQ